MKKFFIFFLFFRVFRFFFPLCRYGLQCVTLNVFLTFFLGLFYRSAALYHPQRRAILHLKTQRRKVKDKNRRNNRTQYFDFKTLRSQTVRIILLSSSFAAFGIYIPVVRLSQTVKDDQLHNAELPLQMNLGIAWVVGSIVFGVLVIRNSAECRIARQYLCQVSLFMCAICLLVFTKIQSTYEGYFIIVWTYGEILELNSTKKKFRNKNILFFFQIFSKVSSVAVITTHYAFTYSNVFVPETFHKHGAFYNAHNPYRLLLVSI